ncbi:TPA: TraU family protein [Escherichia coli]|nr:TraU family protein [Escherichia coli]HBV0306832.1 TraU family protein [Escherichia coli]
MKTRERRKQDEYPDSRQCHPFGRSVTRWETGKNPPNTKKNFGYLMWRKRNCVFL